MGIIGTILHNLKNMKRARAIRRMPRAELMAMDDSEFSKLWRSSARMRSMI